MPIRLLEGFRGYLLTDGYEAYSKVCTEYGLIVVTCWAHFRRKFDEAIKTQGLLGPERHKPSLAGAAMAIIQQLYRTEREAKGMSAEEQQRIRQEFALLLLADNRAWLDAHLPIVPRSGLGKAMNYTHKQWPQAHGLRRGQPPEDRQQPDRERDPVVRHRKEELPLLRQGRRC